MPNLEFVVYSCFLSAREDFWLTGFTDMGRPRHQAGRLSTLTFIDSIEFQTLLGLIEKHGTHLR